MFKYMIYSALGDPLLVPSLDISVWPQRTVNISTGQLTAQRMATGADQTTYTYYPAASLHAGRVASMTTPVAAGSGAAAGTTYYDYWPSGQLYRQRGSGTSPVQYTYDPLGRMTTMET